MFNKRKVALYFLAHGALTPNAETEARAIAAAHNVDVKFRNGTVHNGGAPEKADFIAGEPVPIEYMKYPRISPEGVTNAQPAPIAANVETSVEANAGKSEVLQDLASEIGSTGGWGTPQNT